MFISPKWVLDNSVRLVYESRYLNISYAPLLVDEPVTKLFLPESDQHGGAKEKHNIHA
jgi:hypothetical protein